MVDTVHFELHNLHLYPLTFLKFFAIYEGSHSVTKVFVDEDSGEITQATFRDTLVFSDTMRHLPVNHASAFAVPSSHYTVTYNFSPSKNAISFNVSAPKEAYGTNVFQLVSAGGYDSKSSFRRLIRWFEDFFMKYFPEKISFYDVQIHRIDLCYNQFFLSRSDALAYLGEQKHFLPDYCRVSNSSAIPYPFGLAYKNKGFSFKIYHKGEEFMEKDYKAIMKGGNPLGLNCNYIQENADRILRYEVTYRSWYVNYVVSNMLFPFDTAEFNIKYVNNPTVKLLRYLKDAGGIDALVAFKNKQKKFFLAANVNVVNAEGIIADAVIPFDADIFDMLYTHFWLRVKDFQVKPTLSYSQVFHKLDEFRSRQTIMKQYSKDKRSGMEHGRIVMLAALLKTGSLYEIKPLVNKYVWYHIKRDFTKLGIDMRTGSLDVAQPKIDYSDYEVFLTNSGRWHA